jgi:hypothetical protein
MMHNQAGKTEKEQGETTYDGYKKEGKEESKENDKAEEDKEEKRAPQRRQEGKEQHGHP